MVYDETRIKALESKGAGIQDIKFSNSIRQYASSPNEQGRVLTRYEREGDRGGNYNTTCLLKIKVNGVWSIVRYEAT